MIDELVDLLPNFPGSPNRCRCFLHIVNLITKSLLKQFDVPKKSTDAALDDAECKLINLAAGIDMEEALTVAEQGTGGDSEDNDNVAGWVDEMASMSAEEREELREQVQPVCLVLVKVSSHIQKLDVNTHSLLALQTCIQDNPFHNKNSSSVVHMLGRIEDDSPHHAMRCFNPLEFDLRHARVCVEIPQGHRFHQRRARS
jgi:hypothetical protein